MPTKLFVVVRMDPLNQPELVGMLDFDQSAEEESGLMLPIFHSKPKVIQNLNYSNILTPLLLR